MKIYYPDGCEQEWREGLSDWQRRHLHTIHRQGKGLPNRTDHGSDYRWDQRGVVTYDSYGTRRRPKSGHEAMIIRKEWYGFRCIRVHRETFHRIDPETGVMTEETGWAISGIDYVSRNSTGSFPPNDGDRHDVRKLHEDRRKERAA